MTDVSSNPCQMSRREALGEEGVALGQHRGSRKRVLLLWAGQSRAGTKTVSEHLRSEHKSNTSAGPILLWVLFFAAPCAEGEWGLNER